MMSRISVTRRCFLALSSMTSVIPVKQNGETANGRVRERRESDPGSQESLNSTATSIDSDEDNSPESEDSVLSVDSGETYEIESGTIEEYVRGEILGTLNTAGTLVLSGDDTEKDGTLHVASGESYTIESSESATFSTATIDGTLSNFGTLHLTG